MSEKMSVELELRGYKASIVDRNVCSCFVNSKFNISKSHRFKIKHTDTNTGIIKHMIIRADVIDSAHDLIIGYESIIHTQALRELLIKTINGYNEEVNDSLVTDGSLSYDLSDSAGVDLPENITVRTDKILTSDERKGRVKRKLRTNRGSSTSARRNRKLLRQARRSSNNRCHAMKENMDDINHEESIVLALLEGPVEMKDRLKAIIQRHRKVFSTKLNKEPASVTPLEIELREGSVWETAVNASPPRVQTRLKAVEVQQQVDKMLSSGVIRVSKAKAWSQVMLTPKKDDSWRFCIDFRRLNVVTEPNSWPLPKIKQLLERLGSKKLSTML